MSLLPRDESAEAAILFAAQGKAAPRKGQGNAAGDTPTGPEESYLLKEIAAAHTYVGLAQSSRDPDLPSSYLQRALKVLQEIDKRLPHSARGLRAVRTARNDLRRRLEHVFVQMKSNPR